MLTPATTHATTETFDRDALAPGATVIVDFWAPWCGPCRRQRPVMERLATELAERARVVMVNVDEEPALADRFGVQSIPAIMIVRNGQIDSTFLGFTPRERLLERLDALTG